jgi:X-Pro dipeptidyl-peptidase
MISEYVPRGYAVVLSSVRGTGHSEGCFQVGGDLELKDSFDVIDFFSKQSWSTGLVGAGGKSYDSTTQNGVIAKFPHPALKTLFHVSGITDMYRYNGKDGVTYSNGLSFTPRYAVGEGEEEYGVPAGVGSGSSSDETPQSLARLADDAACPELAKHAQSGEGTAADGMRDAYWQERDWTRFLPQSDWNGSIFFVHGLQDWNVKPDNIDPWVDILQQKGLQVKGWLHQETGNGGHLYPMRTDWNVTMLRWLDHYLKGINTGIDHELGFDIMGSDAVWRHSAAWPPAGQRSTTQGVNVLAAGAQTLRLAGVPWVRVTASSPSADPILYASLSDVAADGVATKVNEATRRVALNDALTGPSGYVPGTSQAFNLTFYPMDLELASGHTLRLDLGYDPVRQVHVPTSPMDLPQPPTGPDGNAGFVITSGQAQVTYGNTPTVGYTLVGLDALAIQPGRTPCFAC